MSISVKVNEDYFPIEVYRVKGRVVSGFGRGSKLLGFPTANLDPQAFLNVLPEDVAEGVYLGFAKIDKPQDKEGNDQICPGVHKAMLSLGTNPMFNTKEKTLEAYIDHKFAGDFYDHTMTLVIVAYRRPQLKFDSLEALIAAIQHDVDVGNVVLDLDEFKTYATDPSFN